MLIYNVIHIFQEIASVSMTLQLIYKKQAFLLLLSTELCYKYQMYTISIGNTYYEKHYAVLVFSINFISSQHEYNYLWSQISTQYSVTLLLKQNMTSYLFTYLNISADLANFPCKSSGAKYLGSPSWASDISTPCQHTELKTVT